jgi:hypothetical protein
MPVRFRRRIRISPGISLNVNKRSVSASFGHRGAHITVGPKGRGTTIGLPAPAYLIQASDDPNQVLQWSL